MTFPPETLGFCFSPHKDICGILSENLVPQILQEYLSIN